MRSQKPALVLMTMHATDALDSDRWEIVDPISTSHKFVKENSGYHIWVFKSRSPLNITPFMFVGWGVGPRCGSRVCAFGATETAISFTSVAQHIMVAMETPKGAEFRPDPIGRWPWIRFVTTILPDATVRHLVEAPQAPKARTIPTMLSEIAMYPTIFNQTRSRVITHLSCPTFDSSIGARNGPNGAAPKEGDEFFWNVFMCCLQIGQLCAEKAMELVFWPVALWDEAVDGSEIFEGSIIPDLYIPDDPQLWFFEEAIPYLGTQDDPRCARLSPDWRITSMVLVPDVSDGRRTCTYALILQKAAASGKTVDDALPRVIVRGTAVAGRPCDSGYADCMAGLEFMQEVIPRTRFEYPITQQRDAERRGVKLQPYSVMEVRRLQRLEDSDSPRDEHSGERYHYSFFQRRHRRRLKNPRKSDGVQVIRVAAGQKLKHLPLAPPTERVINVRR